MFAWFLNMKAMSKLMTGFALMGVFMMLVGVLALSNMSRINDVVELLYVK
ncbi:MAG: hypothetical protein U0223_14040 [Nitrospira sp.]|nr:hypothetical protein [Nitrospira sp.]